MFDRRTGHEMLWLAVMQQAIADVSYASGQVRDDAEAWLTGGGNDFIECCERAGLDPDWALAQIRNRSIRLVLKNKSGELGPLARTRLMWLARHDWIKVKDFATEFGLRHPAARAQCVRFEGLGYVEMETRAGNRKGTAWVRLTPRGRALVH